MAEVEVAALRAQEEDAIGEGRRIRFKHQLCLFMPTPACTGCLVSALPSASHHPACDTLTWYLLLPI